MYADVAAAAPIDGAGAGGVGTGGRKPVAGIPNVDAPLDVGGASTGVKAEVGAGWTGDSNEPASDEAGGWPRLV